MPAAADLPDDVEALKAELVAARALVIEQKIELEKLRFEIACLKRMKYGRSSEQLDTQIAQMQLTLEDLEATLAETPEPLRPAPKEAVVKPVRRPLPAHLPREDIVHDTACSCPACGGTLRRLGEDVGEMIEYVPGRYKVVRHVRPKFSCAACQKIVQASAPSRPIARGLAGPAFLAHVLVSKYADHLPLYRQSQIYAREGLELDRSTLADWVGGASELLEPLVAALGRYVMSATSSMAMTRRCRCSVPDGAPPSRGGCGHTCGMIDRPRAPNRPRCCSATLRTARASDPRPT